MTRNRARAARAAFAALALAAVGVGLTQTAGTPAGRPLPLASIRNQLNGSPAPLALLHRQAGELLPGGASAFKQRLRALRGYPVVVNKWASWCPPCRHEFPALERAAAAVGRRVAFIGVDSSDDAGAARTFLARYPVPYPSYTDPNVSVAALFYAVAAFPTTAFYRPDGRLGYIHQGAYPDAAGVLRDVARYTQTPRLPAP